MTWGMTLKDVPLLRVTRRELIEEKDALTDNINDARQRLLALAACAPHTVDIDSETKVPWDQYVCREVKETVDSMLEDSWKLGLVVFAMENPDCVASDEDNWNKDGQADDDLSCAGSSGALGGEPNADLDADDPDGERDSSDLEDNPHGGPPFV